MALSFTANDDAFGIDPDTGEMDPALAAEAERRETAVLDALQRLVADHDVSYLTFYGHFNKGPDGGQLNIGAQDG